SFFDSLLRPRPPRSALFPYTTLFRSEVAERSKAPDSKSGVGVTPPGVRIPPSPPVYGGKGEMPEWPKGHDWKSCVPQGTEGSNPDRKSTRLNSSHVSISYAVFCLKKK